MPGEIFDAIRDSPNSLGCAQRQPNLTARNVALSRVTQQQFHQGPFGEQLTLLRRFNGGKALTLREAVEGSGISWPTTTEALKALFEYGAIRLLTPEPRPNSQTPGDDTACKLTAQGESFLAFKAKQP